MNQFMGEQKRSIPSVVAYEGKEVKGAEKMKAWGKMFQGDQMQPIDEAVERWICARNKENWAWTRQEYRQELDSEIQWE